MDPPTGSGSGPRRQVVGEPQRKKVAMAAGGDDLNSALPDALIHRVMSFLQAPEAVQTCVLSQRWRHLWKSIPVLRLTRAVALRSFLDHFLLLRDGSPLDACFFRFTIQSRNDTPLVNLWARHALRCQVRVLVISVSIKYFAIQELQELPLYNLPVVSPYLIRLVLRTVALYDKFLDFSSCQALKNLKLIDCWIGSDKIYSPSLTSLSILECRFFLDTRTCISAPSLISLQLDGTTGITPFIENMPVLETAVVILGSRYYDTDDESGGCVLLKGLSAATNLELKCDPEVFILKRELRCCPTFSKLKTLILNGRCGAAGDCDLIFILQHSPVLERVTIEHPEECSDMIQSEAIYSGSKKKPFASESLTGVEVKWYVIDQRVCNILKALNTPMAYLLRKSVSRKLIHCQSLRVSALLRAEVCDADGRALISWNISMSM